MTQDPFSPPEGISPLKFRLLMWKRYFDQGLSTTSYLKYLVAFFGASSKNVGATMIVSVVFGIACFVIGWWWYRYGLIEIDTEIGNRFNYFVKEMREKINPGTQTPSFDVMTITKSHNHVYRDDGTCHGAYAFGGVCGIRCHEGTKKFIDCYHKI